MGSVEITRGSVTIRVGEKPGDARPRVVSAAWLVGPFAIHDSREGGHDMGWMVTHVASGFGVVNYRTEAEAIGRAVLASWRLDGVDLSDWRDEKAMRATCEAFGKRWGSGDYQTHLASGAPVRLDPAPRGEAGGEVGW